MTSKHTPDLAEAVRKARQGPWRCEGCGLGYAESGPGVPDTEDPFTCDDCGSAVEEVEGGQSR
jgi:hypothetical protein